MRLALVGASLALVAGMSAACGGSTPDDADKGDFCDAWKNTSETMMTEDNDFDKMKKSYEEAFDVGTPENISDDAREGFEVMDKEISKVDSEKDLEDADELSDDDTKKVEKFNEYLTKECGDALTPDAPDASDVPEAPESE